MNKTDFWRIIDDARHAAGGDPDKQVDALGVILTDYAPPDLVAFDRIFMEFHDRAYNRELWAAAYIIGGGCSDDGFADFRNWLISRGEEVYDEALRNPDSLAEVVTDADGECQSEELSYVVRRVYKNLTQQNIDDAQAQVSPSELVGRDWEESVLDERYPNLSRRFG